VEVRLPLRRSFEFDALCETAHPPYFYPPDLGVLGK
jgi:hypothetical protein